MESKNDEPTQPSQGSLISKLLNGFLSFIKIFNPFRLFLTKSAAAKKAEIAKEVEYIHKRIAELQGENLAGIFNLVNLNLMHNLVKRL